MVDSKEIKEEKEKAKVYVNYPTLADEVICKAMMQNAIRMACQPGGTTMKELELMVKPFADPEGKAPNNTDRNDGDGIHRMATNDIIRMLSALISQGGAELLKHDKKRQNGSKYPGKTIRIYCEYKLEEALHIFGLWHYWLGEYNVLRGEFKIKIKKNLPSIRDGQEGTPQVYQAKYV